MEVGARYRAIIGWGEAVAPSWLVRGLALGPWQLHIPPVA
mgnify:CR=1 FL=1